MSKFPFTVTFFGIGATVVNESVSSLFNVLYSIGVQLTICATTLPFNKSKYIFLLTIILAPAFNVNGMLSTACMPPLLSSIEKRTHAAPSTVPLLMME